MCRCHRGRRRIGLFGAFDVAEECQDEGAELVGAFDLRLDPQPKGSACGYAIV
jgi:hypothetical protein